MSGDKKFYTSCWALSGYGHMHVYRTMNFGQRFEFFPDVYCYVFVNIVTLLVNYSFCTLYCSC